MVKLLYFHFQVTSSRLKNKNNSLRVTYSMGALLFSHFRVKFRVKFLTHVKLINEEKSLIIAVSK